MPANNATFKATTSKIDYTITTVVKNNVGGTLGVNKTSAHYGDEVTIIPTRATGYKIKTLTVTDEVTVTDNKFTMPASNVTVTVEYEKDTYTATFVIGNTTCGTNQVVFGEAVTIPETCVADTGYSLGNWDDELVMDEEGKTFTTTSTAIDYTIIKVSTNGTIGVKTTANYNEEVTLTLTPTEGYELDTLTVKDASNNEVAVTNNKFTMPASNVTVTATFKKSTYTATFVIGNTTCGTKQVVFGEVVGAPVLTNCVLEEGYEIKNWSPVIGNMPAGDTTYKATVGLKQFTVTFVDYNNTQIGSTQVVDYNASATAPTIPTRQGYTFSSWDKSFTNVKSNITVKALYTANLKEIRLEKANSNINLAFQEESVVNIKENIKVVKVYYDDNEIIATDNEFNITGFSTSTIGTFNMRATLIENNMNSNALEYRITSYPVFNTLFKVDYNNTGKYLRTKNRDCTSKCDSGNNVSYVENVNFNFLEITEYYDQIIDTKEVRIKFVGESGYTVLNKSPYFVSGYMNSYSNLIRWNTSTQSVSHPVILAAGSLQSINLGYSPYDNVGVYKEGTDAVPTGKAIDKVYIQYRIDTDNDRETNDEVDMYVIFKYQSDGTFKAIDGN